jgi:hypothetical protein
VCSNCRSKEESSIEDEWLNHTEKVTVDEYPPAIDETANRRVTNLTDGTHEVTFECEYCQLMFITPAQLTGGCTLFHDLTKNLD